jgi:hypothetical protein
VTSLCNKDNLECNNFNKSIILDARGESTGANGNCGVGSGVGGVGVGDALEKKKLRDGLEGGWDAGCTGAGGAIGADGDDNSDSSSPMTPVSEIKMKIDTLLI